jgi:hypothetical protein
MEWILELILAGLLAATMFHAIRLERALGVLKRDRAALEELVADFNASTRQAEAGIDRLRVAADGTGRQIARQIDAATELKDDLTFLLERGGKVADRLDGVLRSARPLEAARSQDAARGFETDRARIGDRPRPVAMEPVRLPIADPIRGPIAGPIHGPEPAEPRVRSQAERDLLKALRMVR